MVLAGFLLVGSSLLATIPAAYAEDMYALEVGGGMTATVNDDKGVLRLGTYTYEFWLRDLDGPTGSWRRVFVKGGGAVNTGRGPNVGLFPSEPALQYAHSTGAGQLAVRTSEEIPVDEWIHVALVLTGLNGQQMIYLNGVQDAVANVTGLAQETQEPVLTVGNAAHVILDDFRIWNYARSQEEIETDMNHEVTGFEDGLVGYWRFNEGGGTIAHDLSPYENHGTIAGAIWTTESAPIASSDPIAVATRPEPMDGALVEATWTNLTWVSGAFAVSHDLYIGTSFNDVNDGVEGTFAVTTMSNTQILGFSGFPIPDGLVPGTTYYWKVDEVNDANAASPWKGDVWSFTVPPKAAYNAEPADGMEFILPNVTLSWTGGLGANLHHVYFGDSFADVNDAAGAPPTAAPTFSPETLELGKTYYWRVDEFDGTELHKGDVWSFTTVPDIEVTNPNLKLWWDLDEGMGRNVVDRSGHGNHGVINGEAQWIGGYLGTALMFGQDVYVESEYAGVTGTAPRTCSAWVRTPTTGNHSIMSWGQNQTGQKWRMRVNGDPGVLRIEVNGGYHYGVTPITDGLWHHVAVTFEDDGTPDVVDTLLYVDGQRDVTDVSQSTDINTGSGPVRIGESPWHNEPFLDVIDDARIYDKVLTAEEIQLAMRIDPRLAWHPVPENETLAPMNFADTPSWSAGDGVSQYDIYFGSDRAAVEAADASGTSGIYRGRQSSTSYALPDGVEPDSGPFYWRVDSVTIDGTIVTGRLWNFTVADYSLIDDFETYNDVPAGEPGSNLVYVAWVDGFDNPNANGSTMGYVTGVSMETDTVLSGSQSVPLQYNNATAGVSEVVRTFTPARDWTANDMQTLSLSFVGSGTNLPGQLYIKVNGVQVNYPGNQSNLALAGWQTWNIPLATINANPSNVTSMAVGIQGAGATGTLILDNIRLYSYPAETITPVQPDPAGLMLHYAFEGNTNDSAGANHGTAFGSPTYVMGKADQAIMLDGLDDYVAIDNFSYAKGGHAEITVSAWIRTAVEDNQIIVSFDRNEYWRLEINGDGGGPGDVGWDVMTDAGQVDYGSNARVDDDQWHHVSGVFDNGKLTVYIDGNPQPSALAGATFGTGTPRYGYVGLGSESTEFNLEPRTPASFFSGSVDDVRIYERALTDGEVAGLAGRTNSFDKHF
jgi:hypothetical protein